MRVAIVGGTFDPFHRGHLEPVLAIREQIGSDRVVFMPAYRQPFKSDREHASGHHRFAMAALATYDTAGVYVSDLELERGEISYTVDTLERLHDAEPSVTYDWVIGDDNVAELLEWKSIDRILELANFVVLRRGEERAVPDALRDRVVDAGSPREKGTISFVANDTVPVSSTEVRRRVRAGEPIAELVGDRVSRYIQRYGLYREGQW